MPSERKNNRKQNNLRTILWTRRERRYKPKRRTLGGRQKDGHLYIQSVRNVTLEEQQHEPKQA